VLDDRPDLDRAEPRDRRARGPLEGLVEVVAVEQVVAAEDLLGRREWAVDDLRLAVADPEGRGHVDRSEPVTGDQDPGLLQAAVELDPQRDLAVAPLN